MSYVRKSLGETEYVVKESGFPPLYHIGAWACLIFLGVVLVGVIIFVRSYIWMNVTEIALTDRRLIIKRGWIRRETLELPLSAIELVEVEQSFWGRIFGFGKLIISGSGTGQLTTPTIDRPIAFRKLLSEVRARGSQ